MPHQSALRLLFDIFIIILLFEQTRTKMASIT